MEAHELKVRDLVPAAAVLVGSTLIGVALTGLGIIKPNALTLDTEAIAGIALTAVTLVLSNRRSNQA